jgi:serine/threonine protein phosphatase PrpC
MLPSNLPRLLQQYSSHATTTATKASSTMQLRAHHAPLLFTFMACIGFRPLTTFADGPGPSNSTGAGQRDSTGRGIHHLNPAERAREDRGCPFYGCPLLPTDVHYNTDAIKATLEKLRDVKRTQAGAVVNYTTATNATATNAATKNSTTDSKDDGIDMTVLREFGNSQAATLTLVGYKGGALIDQINQDRAFVISPFFLSNNTNDKENKQDKSDQMERKLLGVFDGHAPLGELVSEFTRTELPVRLAEKLKALELENTQHSNKNSSSKETALIDATKNILIETFVELDERAPAEKSGGCTATVVLQLGSKVYFANAGDSRSFLVAYRPSTNQTSVVYITREDKPSLADERARVEKMGGQVYIPVRGTSRVVYHDRDSGAPTGLAMSRSIGDWEAGKLGVIPDPIVDVLDLKDVVAAQLDGTAKEAPEAYEIDGRGEITEMDLGGDPSLDDVHIFAVSATDGK